jgi:hypothetical protein
VRPLRAGELLAGAGAIALAVLLFLDWFSADDAAGADATGWGALGWLVLAFAILAIVAAGALVGTTVRGSVSQAVGAGVITALLGTIAFLVLAVRVLLVQPDLGGDVSVALAGWLGLLAALAIPVGGWWSIADERTGAPESAYVPPPARPAPPP